LPRAQAQKHFRYDEHADSTAETWLPHLLSTQLEHAALVVDVDGWPPEHEGPLGKPPLLLLLLHAKATVAAASAATAMTSFFIMVRLLPVEAAVLPHPGQSTQFETLME